MGGNVFKNTHEVVRLEAASYFEYVDQIKDLLSKLNLSLTYHAVQAIYSKESFGDMDVVVNTNSKDVMNAHEAFIKELGYPVSRNGDVLSFLYKNFQIDLLFIPEESFDYACNYFAWNDLGNILGRLAKKMGVKHGHAGLFYVQRDGDVVVKEHLLSNSYYTIIDMLELSRAPFDKGFETTLEMFEWVASSPYFDPEIFKFENLNHINRVRDRKRKTYNELLTWCEEFHSNTKPSKAFPLKENRREFVLNLFPAIAQTVIELDIDIALNRAVAQKFNGKHVMEWIPELSGKALGAFLTYFKSGIEMYRPYILNASEEEIRADVLISYELFKVCPTS
jgi:hypothetical protein